MRSPVECPKTPHGLPVALLVERPAHRGLRVGRLALLALGLLLFAAAIWVAVRGSHGARAVASDVGVVSVAATPHARTGSGMIQTRVDSPTPAEPVGTNGNSARPGRIEAPAAAPACPTPSVRLESRGDAPPAPDPSAREAQANPSSPLAEAVPGGPEADLPHLKLWSSTFGGGRALARVASASDGAGTSVDARTLAGILRRALSHGALAPASDGKTSLPGMRARALAGKGSMALWLIAPGEHWGDPVAHARVTVPDVEPGRWRVTWLDDVSGAEIASEELNLATEAMLAVPTFQRHVAALLEREDAP